MIAALRADEGEGAPVVYVPGIDGTGDMLLGTTERLAERFRLVRLRYLPDGADGYPELAASIDALLEELGLERVVVLTESFGGAVSLQLALDHPERVAALGVVNSFAYHPWRARLWMSRVASPVVQGRLFRVCRRTLSPIALFGPRGSREIRRAFRAVGGIGLDAPYRRRLQMIRGLDLRPRLGELKTPLALFAADADRIVPSVPAASEIRALVPHATLEVLPGAGHLVLPLPDEPWPERVAALARLGEV
jgi:pimeloyl-ACP methyl ester carboxylesterase